MAKPERKPDPDSEPDYDVADPEYDETPQHGLPVGADPEYNDDIRDPDAEEASQEYQKRSQK